MATTRLLLRELRPARCRCQVRPEVIAGGRAVLCPLCKALMLLDAPRLQTPDPSQRRNRQCPTT
jgi:hypothetical protein